MTYDEISNIYTADDDDKMFVRISDNRVFGDSIQLGVNDTIDNFEERVFTEEERAAFWESIGMKDPKKKQEEEPQNNSSISEGVNNEI